MMFSYFIHSTELKLIISICPVHAILMGQIRNCFKLVKVLLHAINISLQTIKMVGLDKLLIFTIYIVSINMMSYSFPSFSSLKL